MHSGQPGSTVGPGCWTPDIQEFQVVSQRGVSFTEGARPVAPWGWVEGGEGGGAGNERSACRGWGSVVLRAPTSATGKPSSLRRVVPT